MAYTYNGVTYTADQNVDYQSRINKAAASGDLASAAIYEQQRNAKIDDSTYGGKQQKTYNYASYLGGTQTKAEDTAAYQAAQQQIAAQQANLSALQNAPSAQQMAAQNPVMQPISEPPKQYDKYDPTPVNNMLQQQYAAAQQQQAASVDYATEKAVADLQRTEQDAQGTFQKQRNEVAADEAKGLDNSALYAEARGDKGGIGQAQYNAIQAAAAQNRLAINQQQTKLATDTARQISDLRAQGEYDKADKLLELTQSYLSQLVSIEQWATEFNMNVDQLNESIRQWQANYNMSVQELNLGAAQWDKTYQTNLAGLGMDLASLGMNSAQWATEYNYQVSSDQKNSLASTGEALLTSGILPSVAQLSAMGMTKTQAQSYITAQQVAAAAKASGKSSGGGGSSSGTASGSDKVSNLYSFLCQNGIAPDSTSVTTYLKTYAKQYGVAYDDLDTLLDGYSEYYDKATATDRVSANLQSTANSAGSNVNLMRQLENMGGYNVNNNDGMLAQASLSSTGKKVFSNLLANNYTQAQAKNIIANSAVSLEDAKILESLFIAKG